MAVRRWLCVFPYRRGGEADHSHLASGACRPGSGGGGCLNRLLPPPDAQKPGPAEGVNFKRRHVPHCVNFLPDTCPGPCRSDCRPRGDRVPAVRPMFPGFPEIAARRRPNAVAHCHADMLHDRVVAIAIDHASGAAITYALRSVEVSDIAERPVPVVAPPELQVPIQIEGFPPRQAAELFGLA